MCAMLGFYSAHVQHVVEKYPDIPQERMQSYFLAVANAVKNHTTRLEVNAWPDEWRCVFQLGEAISAVMADKQSVEYWLLHLNIGTIVNMKYDSWSDIRNQIVRNGGPKSIELETIRKTASRLRLCGDYSLLDAIKERDSLR
jgi:hypothetical protein